MSFDINSHKNPDVLYKKTEEQGVQKDATQKEAVQGMPQQEKKNDETQCMLKDGERIDDLHRNGYRIIQKTNGFCFGMDAVLLSAFTKVRKDECVLDFGTGTGIIPILLEAKTKGKKFYALEIQEQFADMAKRSVALNQLQHKIEIIHGDIKNASMYFDRESFHVITCNPPYMTDKHGLQNPNSSKAIARHELCCTFEDIVVEAKKLLKPMGRLFLVHRTFRIAELICTLSEHGLEPKTLRFVYPYVDREPNIVLIEAIKGAKPRVNVQPPLIVYKEPGVYTDEIYDIYGE